MAAMQGKKNHTTSTVIKGQTIRKLMGGGGGEGKVQKKIFAQGKIKLKKIHARQLTLKKNHAMA